MEHWKRAYSDGRPIKNKYKKKHEKKRPDFKFVFRSRTNGFDFERFLFEI